MPSEMIMEKVKIVHRRLIEDLERTGSGLETRERVSDQAFKVANSLFPGQTGDLYQEIAQLVADRLLGLGALEPLLRNPEITEIMVNGLTSTYIEKNGKIEKTDVVFTDGNEIMAIINQIVAKIGRRIDESSPYVDGRLPDGSRINAIIPPLALNGPTLNIRRFPSQPFTLERLLDKGTMSHKIAAFLKASVIAKRNLLISGGTGSGKTSTLNALAKCIPAEERIITIEDAAEMKLDHPHVVSLESRPPNIEGKGEIPIRALLKNALRMRPDRIIVGETRGGEALDMLQAMNTGHQGSITTIHANAPEEALLRLETMVLMADIDLPLNAVRAQIASAINLIIQQERLIDGTRKIVSVYEVNKRERGGVSIVPIFLYDKDKQKFTATGEIPTAFYQFGFYGVKAELDWLTN